MPHPRTQALGPWVLATAGLLILVDQVASLVPQLYPFRVDIPIWRYQAVLLLTGRLTPVLFGGVLVLVAAAVAGSRAWLRALGVLSLLLALLAVVAIGSFLLDALEVRRILEADERARFTINSARVLGTLGLATLFLLWLGIVTVRTPAEKARGKDDSPSLIVGAGRREGGAS